MQEYRQGGKVLLILSLIAVIIAAIDYLNNSALLGLGADSWMLVGIALGVWAIAVNQWKSEKGT